MELVPETSDFISHFTLPLPEETLLSSVAAKNAKTWFSTRHVMKSNPFNLIFKSIIYG
jgi:hypothetical protein